MCYSKVVIGTNKSEAKILKPLTLVAAFQNCELRMINKIIDGEIDVSTIQYLKRANRRKLKLKKMNAYVPYLYIPWC